MIVSSAGEPSHMCLTLTRMMMMMMMMIVKTMIETLKMIEMLTMISMRGLTSQSHGLFGLILKMFPA